MRVREYNEGDLEALPGIHASQGFGYEFPDLSNPLFLTKLVLANEDADEQSSAREACDSQGKGQGIAGAALLRLTAEAYLLIDPKIGRPRERWLRILLLHEAARREAIARGLEDVHAWLPPEIATKFGRRLRRLGWVRDSDWTPYCQRLMSR